MSRSGMMRRWGSSPRLILLLGFAVYVVYAYPGYMSSDSCVQLHQARTHVFSDGHPPVMAALWMVVELVVTGPIGMLLIQGSLWLCGSYRLLRRELDDRKAAIAASAILLFPPILAPMAVIWKDCQMAGFAMMGISLVVDTKPSRRWIGVGLLAIAAAMRLNAAAATLPILVLLFVWRAGQRWWKRIALGVLIWVATVGAAVTTNRLLATVHDHTWYYSLGPADIAGVLSHSRRYEDPELLQVLEGTPLVVHEQIFNHIRHVYSPLNWYTTTNGPGRTFNWPENDAQREAVLRAWRTLVFDNPLSYVHHRLRVFQKVLGLTDQFTTNPLLAPVRLVHLDEFQVEDPTPRSGAQRKIGEAMTWMARKLPLFRPYLYFFLALLLLPFAWRQRDVLALLASGLLYELTLLPLAPTPEYRYSHWMIACTVVSTVILVRRRMVGVVSADDLR